MQNGYDYVVEGLRAIRHNLFENLSAQRNAATLMRELTPPDAGCQERLRSIEQRCVELIDRGRLFLLDTGILGKLLLRLPELEQRPAALTPHPPERSRLVDTLIAELVLHLRVTCQLLWEDWRRLEQEHSAELAPKLLQLCGVVQEESASFSAALQVLERQLLDLAGATIDDPTQALGAG